MSTAQSYDEFPYPGYSHGTTHVGRLAAIGRLFGLPSTPPGSARILEIGCGSGINLLAMAQLYPSSEFVGVDFSSQQIVEAERTLAATGLGNVRFLNLDIRKLEGEDLGRFDYIIVHGIYSWVPEDVRKAILATCRDRTTDNGIALISYNCLPGWRLRGALREMMLIHTSRFGDVNTKVTQSKALMKYLAEATGGHGAWGQYLKQESETILTADNSYLAHDYLEIHNHALYFRDFLAEASSFGLSFLTEAEPATVFLENYPETIIAPLKAMGLDHLETEQFLDFVRNRTFRSTLLCRDSAVLDRRIGPERLEGMYARTHFEGEKEATGAGSATFHLSAGRGEVTVKDEAGIRLLRRLLQSGRRPEALASVIGELSEGVPPGERAGFGNRIGAVILQGYFRNFLDLTLGPVPATPPRPEGKPEALPLARWQAVRGSPYSLPTLDMIPSEILLTQLLPLCNGTKEKEELIAGMLEGFDRGEYRLSRNGSDVTDRMEMETLLGLNIDRLLDRLRLLGLLLPTEP
jgi:SAM-dependent methyltransferase